MSTAESSPEPGNASDLPRRTLPRRPLKLPRRSRVDTRSTRRLGRGAYGEVYKAQDTRLNRVVAIKRIRLDYCSARFEASLMMFRKPTWLDTEFRT